MKVVIDFPVFLILDLHKTTNDHSLWGSTDSIKQETQAGLGPTTHSGASRLDGQSPSQEDRLEEWG